MPTLSLYVRAHRPAGHPDALIHLTVAELATLRLEGLGKPATEPQLSETIRRMEDQAAIGQLVLEEQITPQSPVWTGYYLKTVDIAHDDDSFAPDDRGKTKTTAYKLVLSGPMPTDPKEYEDRPDLVECVVTPQAARDLYAIDPENWSDAALTWCNGEKQLSLQEQLDRLGVPMTPDEVEALKTETCKKQELRPEIKVYLEKSGHGGLTFDRIMLKKTSELYPWVNLADAGTKGFCYRHLLLRLFAVMLPDKRTQSGTRLHLIPDVRRHA